MGGKGDNSVHIQREKQEDGGLKEEECELRWRIEVRVKCKND